MKDFRVDLKVCEGCGALWLRAGTKGCTAAVVRSELAEFPAVRRSRRGRKRKSVVRTAAVCVGGAR